MLCLQPSPPAAEVGKDDKCAAVQCNLVKALVVRADDHDCWTRILLIYLLSNSRLSRGPSWTQLKKCIVL
eukprot:m.456855 g.456855  ORF g.456855 m.456855 type:complete len:70 (-) comp21131_c0_seq1:55-264(-)